MLASDRNTRLPLSPRWTPRRAALMRWLAGRIYPLIAQVKVSGTENIPTHGRCILVFNHLSNFDGHLIFCHLPRRDVCGLVASEYSTRFVHSFLVEAAGGLWLRRGAADRATLRHATALLRRGWLVGIAPEGRRSPTRSLVDAKRGAAALARRTDAPILPVAVTGTSEITASLCRLRRPVVTLTFGRPFRLDWPLNERPRKKQLQRATDELMSRVATLLPSAYQGVYTPRSGTPYPESSDRSPALITSRGG